MSKIIEYNSVEPKIVASLELRMLALCSTSFSDPD